MSEDSVRMDDRVRDAGEGLIVAFPEKNASIEGESLDTLKAYFFKVAEQQRFYYRYSDLGSFNAGESSDFAYLGDTGHGTGDDVLRMHNDDFHVLHFGVGLESTDLRVYEKVDPSSGSNTALDYSGSSDNADPTVPSDFGYYNGAMVDDRYNPNAFTERVAFRNDKEGEFLQYGFYADDALTTTESDLHLVGRGYKLLPVTDSDTQDKMQRAINVPDDQAEVPTTLVIEGGLEQYNPGTQTPDDWSDAFAQTLTYGTGARV